MSSGPADLKDQKFVSLSTFKRNGDAVASAMWIVGDGELLWAWTPADAWKVKRIRRDPRVILAPCGRTGKVRPGQPVVDATAEVVTDADQVARVESLVKRKYGVEFRLVTLIEAVLARGRKPRFAIRITPSQSRTAISPDDEVR
ncbi:PPOX class F420-dependent oxidoreductase [Mycobacterium shigaense]|uniref:PPOX class F420-dependent oxidoreductase n=1 Tax=Mycobacterium shigaense TaxID=722731 RepID=UPI002ADFB7E2|nr:PPOX class F420-dependent oxidoreductase [Mycobacterium shigaense]MEA1123637.1 PPOX class F420-dependent oxidoreductase [Mycobacterium shigaense]